MTGSKSADNSADNLRLVALRILVLRATENGAGLGARLVLASYGSGKL